MPKQRVGISYLTYELPTNKSSLAELGTAGKLHTKADTLREFGFDTSFIVENDQDLFKMQIRVLDDLLGHIDHAKELIDSIFVYHGVSSEKHTNDEVPLSVFRYSTSRLQFETQLQNTPFLTLSQQGCNGLLNAIWLGKRLLEHSEKRYILIVSADRLQSGSPREIIHNIMSDSAGGLVLDKHSPTLHVTTHHEVNQPYYWDTPSRETEVLAAYFPIAKRVIEETLAKAKLSIDTIDWIVPHNVSVRSWEILSQLVDIPVEKVWLQNVPKIGHTVSTDHIINVKDMQEQHIIAPGERLLLFSFGFGASWAAQIIET